MESEYNLLFSCYALFVQSCIKCFVFNVVLLSVLMLVSPYLQGEVASQTLCRSLFSGKHTAHPAFPAEIPSQTCKNNSQQPQSVVSARNPSKDKQIYCLK